MSVKIRLTRMGDKKSPYYRVVVTDSRTARGGKCIENLGTYNPLVNPFELKLKDERVKYWLGVGAIPTETARELLVKAKLLPAKKYRAPLPKKMPPAPKEKKEETAEAAPAPAAEPETPPATDTTAAE